MKSVLFWPYQIYVWLILLPLVALLTVVFSTLTILFAWLVNPHFASRVFATTWARVLSFLTPMRVIVEGGEHLGRSVERRDPGRSGHPLLPAGPADVAGQPALSGSGASSFLAMYLN